MIRASDQEKLSFNQGSFISFPAWRCTALKDLSSYLPDLLHRVIMRQEGTNLSAYYKCSKN